MERSFNSDLRAYGGYTGDDVTIPDPGDKPTELSEVGRKLKDVTAATVPRPGVERVAAAAAKAIGKTPELSKGATAIVDEIGAVAATGDQEARRALAELVRNPATSAYAR